MPYEPPPKGQAEKDYYDNAEKAMRNIRHDSTKMHQPSIETSTPQQQPYNRDSCRDKILQFFFFAIAVVSYFS